MAATKQQPPAKKAAKKKAAKRKTRRGRTPDPATLAATAPGTGAPPPADGAGSLDGGNEPQPPRPGVDPALLTGVVALPFALWARMADDDRLILRPAEADALAGSLAAVAAKYLPTDSAAAGPEVALLLCVAMTLGPRLAMDRPEKAETTAAPGEQKTGADGDRDAAGRPQEPGWTAPPDTETAARQ